MSLATTPPSGYPTTFNPNALTWSGPFGSSTPGVGGATVAGIPGGVTGTGSFTPGSPLSFGTGNQSGGATTQGAANYAIDPASGLYTFQNYTAPVQSDANSLFDQIIRGASETGLAAAGGLAGGSALGLTGDATTLFGGSSPLFGAASTVPAADASLLAGDLPASDVGGTSGLGGLGGNFLPATGLGSTTPIDPGLAQQLGIDFSIGSGPAAPSLTGGSMPDFFASGAGAGAPSATDAAVTDALSASAGAGGGSGSGWLSQIGSYLSNPAHLASLGLGGLSLVNSLSKPGLPSQINPATAANTTASNAANSVIAGGGTASPNWAQQKSSIDAQIAQELADQSAALQQNAANTGQQGMVVQQQLNKLKQTLETQRQTLYQQAQAANVNQAIAELTGSNQALLSIAQLQMNQDAAAQQASNQLAELALLLASKG